MGNAKTDTQLPLGRSRLLIVDDHAPTRDIIRRILEPLGGTFEEASDGVEAVSRFESSHPDWIVMDISMPVMDGLTATAAIHTADPNARIIVITQHDSPAMCQRALESGACHFLTKDQLTSLPKLITSAQPA